jgi:hypothetical protein
VLRVVATTRSARTFVEPRGDPFGRVRVAEGLRRGAHRREPRAVREEPYDRRRGGIDVHRLLDEEERGAHFLEGPRVFFLVVLGDVRRRDEHARLAEDARARASVEEPARQTTSDASAYASGIRFS